VSGREELAALRRLAELEAKAGGTSFVPMSAGERYRQGLRDPVDAGAQMLTRVLPQGVVSGVNAATKFVNELPVIGGITKSLGMTPATTQDIDAGISKRASEYRKPEGIDWARMGGNITATLPLAASLPVAQTVRGAAGIGAATGGTFGAMQPVTENQDNFWQQKGTQSAIGAATGAVAGPAMYGVSRVISPQTSAPVKKLMDEGVTPTPGQILGGMFKSTEEKLSSVPILGDAIRSSQRKTIEEMNKAVYSRALNPIGGNVPKDVGRDAVADVSRQLSNSYNALLPKMQFKADPIFAQELSKVQQMVSQLPPTQAKQFDTILKNQVIGKLTKQGNASGETIKTIESELGRIAKGYMGDQSFDARQLGSAINEVQSSIRRTLERANPQFSKELSQINQGYAVYARLRDAAGRQGAAEGVFTPAQFSAAVRSADKSVGKGNFARGTAQMQDLSDAAKSSLGNNYPDSGSIGRLLLGAGAVGAGAINPASPGGLALASLPYLPVGRQVAAALLARRPQIAEPVANAVRRIPAGLLGSALYPALE
jgi:hypothetical protein